jgi:DNA-binding LacI/PurR family transcriptional regulator
MGLAAFEALVRRMTETGKPDPVEKILSARLVVRESCGSRAVPDGAAR